MSPSIAWSPAPYHIISYGALLGSSLYQTFVNGIVCYRSLPRPEFSTLQTNLTPVYFTIQTVLPVLIALTYPAPRHGSLGNASPISSGIFGLRDVRNLYSVTVPVLGMFLTGALNRFVLGPKTTKVMEERKIQGKKDGKMSYEPGPQSEQMQVLNRKFSKVHGAAALIDLLGTIFRLWYGFSLAQRMV